MERGGWEPNQLRAKMQSEPGVDFDGPVCSGCESFICDIQIDPETVHNHTSEGQGSTLPMQKGEVLVEANQREKELVHRFHQKH